MNTTSKIPFVLCAFLLGACTQAPIPSLQDAGVAEIEEPQPDQDQAVSSEATEENTEGMMELDQVEENENTEQEDEGFEDSADDFAGGDDAIDSAPAVLASRTVRVTSDNWIFNPATITASLGEGIIFEVVGTTEEFGFVIPELNIIETVPAGEKKEFIVPTNVIGSFEFYCSYPCDQVGTDMSGELVISQ